MARFETVSVVNEPDRDAIYGWLRQHNITTNGKFVKAMDDGAPKPLAVTARDGSGEILGGLVGDTLFDWLRVHVMAVNPENRSNGIGTELLNRAEEEARVRGCTRAYVDTMSYQSPDFYRKLGYSEIGQIPNWDSHGHSKHFFTKNL